MKTRHKITAGLMAFAFLSSGTDMAYADEKDKAIEVDKSIETDETKSLLAEFGVNQDNVDKANKIVKDAQKTYDEAAAKVKTLEEKLRTANERIGFAERDLETVQKNLGASTNDIKESEKAMSSMASTMYKQGGMPQNDLSSYLITHGDASERVAATYMMSRIVEKRGLTLQSQKEQKATQEMYLNRQESVKQEVQNIRDDIKGMLSEAKKTQKEASDAQKNYENLFKNAEKAASDAKIRYEDAVKEAKKQAAEFEAAQRKLLSDAKITPQAFKDSMKILADSSLFPLPLPTDVDRVTSGYGFRPTPVGTIDYGGAGGYVHAGIDYGATCGTPIRAVASGEVFLAGNAGSSGNAVGISHGITGGFTFATRYHHMSSVSVKPGTKVNKGDVLGLSGTTGNSNGCHLHFETLVNGKAVNPVSFLK